MKNRIKFRPLNRLEKVSDAAMYPLMRVLMELNGTPEESPQLTHRWNNKKLNTDEVKHLNPDMMVRIAGDRSAWYLPSGLRHFPVIGWQRYVVLRPKNWTANWFVGWITPDVFGISRIPIDGQVKVLRGTDGAFFFAVDAAGRQVAVEKVGRGKLGDGKFPTISLH